MRAEIPLTSIEFITIRALILDGMKPAEEWRGTELLSWIKKNTESTIGERAAQRILKKIRCKTSHYCWCCKVMSHCNCSRYKVPGVSCCIKCEGTKDE